MKQHTVKATTLGDALREAMRRGNKTVRTYDCTFYPITDAIAEIDPDAPDPEEYVLIGSDYIVRITDAWKPLTDNVYELR